VGVQKNASEPGDMMWAVGINEIILVATGEWDGTTTGRRALREL